MTLRSSKHGTGSPVTKRGAAASRGGRVRAGAPSAADRTLERLQRESFVYFLNEVNPSNGLVADSTRPDSPSSIAAVGFALAAYPVAVERGFLTRTDAVSRTVAALRFFRDS